MSHNPSDYFLIRNWRNFQHYAKRNPPWIKLHYELLGSEDWAALDDASRVLAIACMLIASRHEGRVPKDARYIQRVAYLNQPPDFMPLVRCGFLTDFSPLPIDASTMLARCSQDASVSVSASASIQSLTEETDLEIGKETEDSVPEGEVTPPNGRAQSKVIPISPALMGTRIMKQARN